MNTYAQVLTYAIPGFVALIVIEYLASLILGKRIANSMDTISSLSSGMTNTLKDILKLAVVIISYEWMHQQIALFDIASTALTYVTCFILVDFASYWSHRFNHEINLMWNRHIIHHSSEEFNLSCALRQSISGLFGIYFFLYVPMAIIGIEPLVVAIVAPLHLFAQFWYHTRLIDKMGPLEYIIVTPSHHRVHHAINPEYIDKNYAAIFIIWDKLFGTFKAEDPLIAPVYGVKKPVRTWNPFIINFQHLARLAQDSIRTEHFWDKLRIWFMPTGWRPEDVRTKYPVGVIEDVYTYEKYMPEVSQTLKIWSWIQLIVNNALLYYMLINIADLSVYGVMLYSLFLGASVFSYTSLMDNSRWALAGELIKVVAALNLLILHPDWVGLSSVIPYGATFVNVYIVSSMLFTLYYLFFDRLRSTSLA